MVLSITKQAVIRPDDQKIYLRSKYILTTIRVTVTVTVALDCPCDCPMECPWTVRRTVRGQAVFHIHFSGLAFKVSENPRFSRHLIFTGKTGCNGPFPWTFFGFEIGLSVDCPLECPRTVRRTKQTGGAGWMPVQAVRLFFHGLSCALSAFLDAECPRIFHGHSVGQWCRRQPHAVSGGICPGLGQGVWPTLRLPGCGPGHPLGEVPGRDSRRSR